MSSRSFGAGRSPSRGAYRRARSLALTAALALGCAHAHSPAGAAAAAPARPPAETLHFAWPEHFAAEVVARHESETWGGDPLRGLSRRVLTAERRGPELLVSTRSAAEGPAPGQGRAARAADALVEVVAPDGSFLRADGVDEAVRLTGPTREVPPEVARQALARSAATDWQIMVGAWAGRTLVPGQPIRVQVTGGVPLMATAETQLEVELGTEGRVPCGPDETERRCVELHYRGRTAPADRAAVLAHLREALAGTPGEPIPEDFHGHFAVTVVTEPDTLVPHHILDREFLRVRLRLADGRVREVEEHSEDEYVFATAARGATDTGAPRAAAGSRL